MILQALVKHYENLEEQGKVDQEGWCKAKVSYGVNLSKDGRILGILTLKKEEERGKKKVLVPQQIKVPESANFLCDNSKYILGIDAEGPNQRVIECFRAAKERHLSLLRETEGEMAQAVRSFFETWEPEKASECIEIKERWEEVTDGGNLIFCMGMHYAQDDPFIQSSWERARTVSSGSIKRSKGSREPSPAAQPLFRLTLRLLNLMGKNRAITRLSGGMRSLPILRL